MDITSASTEPFHRFHRFHEAFNRNMRISVGALGVITGMKLASQGTALKLPTLGEPWGAHTLWSDVTKEIPGTKRFLSQIGIISVFSAFEDLLVGVIAEINRNRSLSGDDPHKLSLDVTKLYGELGWDTKVLGILLPAFSYFEVVRNCIAHQSGRANEALVEKAGKSELERCLKKLHGKSGKKLHGLPAITIRKEIPLLPRHAIFASEICYRIAQDIDDKLRHSLGPDGFVYMAAYHALLSDDRIPTNAGKFPESNVNFLLAGRYRVKLLSKTEVISRLRSIGKWEDCRSKFEMLRSQI